MGRIIFSLVVVLMLVMTALFAACSCGLSPNLSPDVAQPAGWPTTWTGLSTDPNEGSGCNYHRNVADNNMDGYAFYYAADSHYLYLRMETVTAPGWPGTGPQDEARYKWWFCTGGEPARVDGTSVKEAEFQLILEDLTDNSNDPALNKDMLGELTLMDDLNVPQLGFKARWDSAKPPNYTINNAQTVPTGPSSWWRRELGTGTPGVGGPQGVMGVDIGYRIDNLTTGGNFVDMYVSWAALGNPPSVCLIWATDNINTNLDQAPNCDRPVETTCLSICVPPIADFHASDTNPCVNQPINFTDNSTGSPTSWSWDVDDDGTEDYNTQNPSHTYTSPGTYTVSLTVSNACGPDTETKTNYITVDPLPDAAFHASDTNPCVNEAINFTDDSTGSPTSWSWDVDDDGTEDYNTQNPSHTYTSPGTYTVSLTVSNACGPDTETKTNYITVDPLPDADFLASDTNPCVNVPIDFTDTSSGSPTSWSWDVDKDGTEDYNTQNPSHTYTSPGTYTVSLTVSNACGSDTETKTNYITVYAKPTASASSNSPICEGGTIQLTGGPDGMTSYSWTGPNGFSNGSQNPSIPNATTLNAGTYYLRVIDGGCTSDPVSTLMVVNESPTADAGADWQIIQGGSVVIGGSPTASGGTGPYTYSWIPTTGLNDAGVANPSASPSVTTTYTVTITDSKGCTDSDDVTVTVTYGCCICGFVYRAGTMEALAGWEVILEKKTSPWLEVQHTTTDANGKYCFCGLGDGEYRVSEVVKSGWTQVSPLPNEHLVTLPGGCCDPEHGLFLDFLNTYTSNPSPTVGWEASPIDKPAVLAPWIALFAVIVAGVSLLVLRRRRTQS